MSLLNGKPRRGLKLVPFFRSLADEHVFHLYAQMFREDIALAVMPIGGRSRGHPNFKAQITGPDSAKASELLQSLNGDRERNINQSACQAIEKLVKDLVWNGSSLYEIFEREEKTNIIYISEDRTFFLPWFTVQLVPRADQAEWQVRYAIIRNSNTWRISIPDSLGGKRAYKKTIKALNAITSGALPEFARIDMNLGIKNSSFSVQEYDLLQTKAVNKATEAWGWNRRDMSSEKQTEYHSAYKRAKFRHAQALLREHITNELNKLFSTLKFDCQLSISGIPTAKEIKLTLKKLEEGEIDFSELYDQTSV
ncbi:hypothetical protein [Pseudomonas chlororaphis]|uniref:hypothetical protein n=1 Tax=Pseudomonas chlororaphis TaxID=587753 RepID=UPI00126792B6|nr:hypothetical protein [Pseudomonas chlororaphis]